MLFFIIFILTLAGSYILPWWAIAIIAFVASLYAGFKSGQAFWSAFAAVFCVWVII
jgi:hydrogenase/urease accessory protein HupE